MVILLQATKEASMSHHKGLAKLIRVSLNKSE